jgi:hypothetical protein
LKNPSAQFSESFHHNIRPQRKYAIFRLRRIKIGPKSKRNTGLSLLTLFVASLFSRAIIALASKARVREHAPIIWNQSTTAFQEAGYAVRVLTAVP